MQTLLVHTRRPLQLMRTCRARSAFSASSSSSAARCWPGLLNPVFWLFYADLARASAANFDPIFPQSLLFLCLFNLLAGNGAFTYLIMLAPIRRGWLDLIPFSFTLFGYWVLISLAAYRALWQLIRDPFFWEKTQHGLSQHAKCRQPATRRNGAMTIAVDNARAAPS